MPQVWQMADADRNRYFPGDEFVKPKNDRQIAPLVEASLKGSGDPAKANPFDQFDPKPANPFDRFDAKPTEAPAAAPKPAEDEGVMGLVKKGPGLMREAVGAVAEPVMAMGSGLAGQLAGNVAGLGAIPLHAAGAIKTEPQDVQRSVSEAMTYQPRTEAGKATTKYNPLALLGKGIGAVGEKAEELTAPPGNAGGPGQAAAGYGIKALIEQLPMLLGAKAPAAAEAAGTATKGLASDMMQSALKPPIAAQRTGKASSAIQTLLDEGINVSKGGGEKLQAKISGLNEAIAQRIENSPATIDKMQVAESLRPVIKKFANQVNMLDDVRAIQKAYEEFINHPLLDDKIPVATAQKMKQGTYKSLGDKSYGELKSADIEAQKALARGLKEEIAKAVPEVRSLNAQESQLINALSLVERRVLMEANKNPVGLGWLTTNPAKFAAYMGDRSGLFKSLIARMINTTGGGIAASGAVGPALGMAVSSQAQQPNQIQPPPQ